MSDRTAVGQIYPHNSKRKAAALELTRHCRNSFADCRRAATLNSPRWRGTESTGADPHGVATCRVYSRGPRSELCCQGVSTEQSEGLPFSASQREYAFDHHSCHPIFLHDTRRNVFDWDAELCCQDSGAQKHQSAKAWFGSPELSSVGSKTTTCTLAPHDYEQRCESPCPSVSRPWRQAQSSNVSV